jgi:serine/threonine protein kinase
VRHPNVVTIHGAEFREGRVGIVMELVTGATSEDVLARQGPWSWRDAAALGEAVARALGALHAADILHCDIKARNVMREVGGRIVLMDLGIGCRTSCADAPGSQGTPLYAAPEMLLARRASSRSDLYALAVLLFHLVTGRYPVEGATREELVTAMRVGRRLRLGELRPDLPAPFVAAVERDLDPRPEARHRSALDLAEALAALRHRSAPAPASAPARPSGPPPSPAGPPAIAVLPFRDLSPPAIRPTSARGSPSRSSTRWPTSTACGCSPAPRPSP